MVDARGVDRFLFSYGAMVRVLFICFMCDWFDRLSREQEKKERERKKGNFV